MSDTTAAYKRLHAMWTNAVLLEERVMVGVIVPFALFRFVVLTLGIETIVPWSLVVGITAALCLSVAHLCTNNVSVLAIYLASSLRQNRHKTPTSPTRYPAVPTLVHTVVAWPETRT